MKKLHEEDRYKQTLLLISLAVHYTVTFYWQHYFQTPNTIEIQKESGNYSKVKYS